MSKNWTAAKFDHDRVLVVDDEPLIVKMVEAVLRDLGVTTVHKANNGAEALDYFDESVSPPSYKGI